MAKKGGFSGSTRYYNSGAYENVQSEVNTNIIANETKVAMDMVTSNFLATEELLKKQSIKQVAQEKETTALLDWGLKNEAELMSGFQTQSAKFGVQNLSLQDEVAAPAMENLTKATIKYKRAKTNEERIAAKAEMDIANKTLSQVIPMFEAYESQKAIISDSLEGSSINKGGGAYLGSNTGNDILLAQTIMNGRGGDGAYQEFYTDASGSIMMNIGANVPSTVLNPKGNSGEFNVETRKFEKTYVPDNDSGKEYKERSMGGVTISTLENEKKLQGAEGDKMKKIEGVNALDFFNRPLPVTPNWKENITNTLDPKLYDDKNNLKADFYLKEINKDGSIKLDEGGNPINKTITENRTLPDGTIITETFHVPDMKKIGEFVGLEIEKIGSGYFTDPTDSQIIYNQLGFPGQIEFGANNSGVLYGNIEQSRANDILTGMANFAIQSGNFNRIKTGKNTTKPIPIKPRSPRTVIPLRELKELDDTNPKDMVNRFKNMLGASSGNLNLNKDGTLTYKIKGKEGEEDEVLTLNINDERPTEGAFAGGEDQDRFYSQIIQDTLGDTEKTRPILKQYLDYLQRSPAERAKENYKKNISKGSYRGRFYDFRDGTVISEKEFKQLEEAGEFYDNSYNSNK